MGQPSGIYYSTVTINGSATSNAANSSGGVLAGIYIPAGLAGTSLTFTACSTPDGTYVGVYDETNTQISVVVPAAGSAQFMSLRNILFFADEYVKIVSSATETTKDFILAFQRVV